MFNYTWDVQSAYNIQRVYHIHLFYLYIISSMANYLTIWKKKNLFKIGSINLFSLYKIIFHCCNCNQSKLDLWETESTILHIRIGIERISQNQTKVDTLFVSARVSTESCFNLRTWSGTSCGSWPATPKEHQNFNA